MRKKSKELLDNLNKIIAKPNKFERPINIPISNKMWKSAIESGIRSLPKIYDKDPWTVDEEDEDKDSYKYFDRMYGGLGAYGTKLVQKDGTEYEGKLYNKRRLIKSGIDDKGFYSHCHMTADGRWFENSGFPIEAPNKADQQDEEEKPQVSFSSRELTDEEKAEQSKWKQRTESDMLKKLK
jgi:hypothetical protein